MTLRHGALFLAILIAGAAPAQEPPATEPDAAPFLEAPAPLEGPAPEDAPSQIDSLFATLLEADKEQAAALQRRIAQLWSVSGSDSMDFLLRRGREALDEEQYDKAVAHFTALVTLAPDFAEGWNARATAHFLRDEFWLSVADIQRVLALEPRHFGALAGLGVMLERIGEDAAALRVHREALRVNPHLNSAIEAVERLAPKVDGRDI